MIERNDSFSKTCASITDGVLNVGIFILVLIFPLVYHDSYFDILETKYQTYYLTVIAMAVILAVLSIAMLLVDVKEYRGAHTKSLLSALLPSNWKKTFRVPDIAILAFWISAGISTLQSDFVYESFWGNEGRFSGFFLMTLYVVTYFLVSRFWKRKDWALHLFLVSGMLMCLFGITDYFRMDIMHFRVNISPYEVDLYTSTIGNINTYTAYVALVMGFSAMMFLTEKKRLVLIWYYLCMVISFFAIIMGSSDNAYLALAALFGLSPFVIFRRHSGIRRYLMMLATFFSVTQCIDWINQIFDGQVVGLDSMFRIIAGYKYLLPFTVLLWVLVIAAWWILEKSSLDERKIGKCCTIVWSVLVFLAIAAVIFVLYDANFAGHAERYNAMKNYLVFDDNWGTKRGYIWKACIRMFRSFPLSHQLFGYGPDTFGILTMKKIHKEMLEVTGFMFDNAHNEYLQDLVTLGVVGLGTYLMFLVTSFWSMCRRGSSDPDSGYLFGILGATVCYSAQAMVNLNLPIVAPMLWLLLSFAMTKKRSGNAAEEA